MTKITPSSTAIATLPSPEQFPRYARAVSAIPELSAAEEHALAVRWHQNQDQDAAKALVLSQLRLVVKAVRDHEGYGLPPGELAQEGTVGLMKAVHKFDPDRGIRLSTYAWYWIEAEIREFILKNWRMVSWGTSALAKKLFFGYRKTVLALRGLGENRSVPTTATIAAAMDVEVEQAELARTYFLGGDVGLQDEHDGDQYEDNHIASAVLSDPENPEDVALSAERTHMLQRVNDLLPSLPERHRAVITSRFLTTPPITFSVLAKRWGVSIERVRQIEASALELMSNRLLPVSPTPPRQK